MYHYNYKGYFTILNFSCPFICSIECANGEWRLIKTLGLTDLATNPERLREKEEQYSKCVESLCHGS